MPAPEMVTHTPRHLLVPFAAAQSPGCHAAMQGLSLPHLEALIQRLMPQGTDEGDESDLSMPHERALAQARNLSGDDGRLPWAAADSDRPQTPQAWFSPCHFQIGMDQVTLLTPLQIGLDEATSRTLCAALAELARDDGIELTFEHSGLWRGQGEPLRRLHSASLDRVSGRPVAPWMAASPDNAAGQRLLQRLHSEAQMLFYNHPANDAREAQRRLPVNGFWVHGAGACTDGEPGPGPAPDMPDTLRQAALHDDWSGWLSAWQTLDAGPVAELLHAADSGQAVRLTLCGERHSRSWASNGTGSRWWQRLGARWCRLPPAGETLSTL
ncbi:MAG: phosphoglycerate mutase [Burkholderiaceae bacterium]